MQKIETVVTHQCVLGEGPVWDHRMQRILWLDIAQGNIHQYTPGTNTFKTFAVGEMIGSIALTEGGLVAALESGFAFIDPDTEMNKAIVDPEKHIAGNRFNEGKADPFGRFWAGTMALSEQQGAGSVYVLCSDLSVERKIENVTISNGLTWSLDQKTLYYIDSPTLQVVSYDYDKDCGSISGRRVIITMDQSEGFPDGMTIDGDGMLWVAHWGGWQVARWNPYTGEKLMQIRLPVSQVTSCTFGGEAFDDLYITSASIGLSESQKEKEPLAGSIFIIKNVGFKGIAAFEFKKQS